MDGVSIESEYSRKCKRRGHHERVLSGRLILDDNLRGDVGVVSEDLWVKLEAPGPKAHGMSVFPLQNDPTLTTLTQKRICVILVSKKTSSSSQYLPVLLSLRLSKKFHGRYPA